ncbi:MAG: hypothetical protein P8168_12185, partial [Deltaproteobacteria bacterium]
SLPPEKKDEAADHPDKTHVERVEENKISQDFKKEHTQGPAIWISEGSNFFVKLFIIRNELQNIIIIKSRQLTFF